MAVGVGRRRGVSGRQSGASPASSSGPQLAHLEQPTPMDPGCLPHFSCFFHTTPPLSVSLLAPASPWALPFLISSTHVSL
jgi:hypothetical protein